MNYGGGINFAFCLKRFPGVTTATAASYTVVILIILIVAHRLTHIYTRLPSIRKPKMATPLHIVFTRCARCKLFVGHCVGHNSLNAQFMQNFNSVYRAETLCSVHGCYRWGIFFGWFLFCFSTPVNSEKVHYNHFHVKNGKMKMDKFSI